MFEEKYEIVKKNRDIQTCKIHSSAILETWHFVPIWIKRYLKWFFDPELALASKFRCFVAFNTSENLAISWFSCRSEPHSTQRIQSFWSSLKEPSDDMDIDVRTKDNTLFDGDIQDQMREGNTSRENPSKPRKEIYPMLFNLTIENGTFVIAVLSAIKVINDSICSKSSNFSIIEHPERIKVSRDFKV